MKYETEMILQKIKSAVICKTDEATAEYADGAAALEQMEKDYSIETITVKDGKVQIALSEDVRCANDMSEAWVQEYIREHGEEPGFF